MQVSIVSRRLMAACFVLIYLFSATAARELLKTPRLVSHFSRHLSQARQVSVAHLFYEHYLAGQDQDNDQSEDQQLPFKSPEQSAQAFPLSVAPPAAWQLVKAPLTGPDNVPMSRLLEKVPDGVSSGVWQPPRWLPYA